MFTKAGENNREPGRNKVWILPVEIRFQPRIHTDEHGFISRNSAGARAGDATAQRNYFGLRREAKRHAALKVPSTIEKRCRRCALPSQSKVAAFSEILTDATFLRRVSFHNFDRILILPLCSDGFEKMGDDMNLVMPPT